MSEPHQLKRVYGEKEIGRILKRATELQDASTAPAAAGITLTELQDIAAEAGIDGQYLRRAALELDAGVDRPSFWSRVTGAPLQIVREVTLPGELPEPGFERVVAVMQTTSGLHGQPALLGRTLTWRAESANKARTVQVVVSVHDGETRVRVEENLSQFAGGLFGGTVGGGGIGVGVGMGLPAAGALGSVALAVAAPVGIVGLSYLLARGIYRSVVSRRSGALDDLLGRIVDEAQSCMNALPESR